MKVERLKARKYWAKRKRREAQANRRLIVRTKGDHDRVWAARVVDCYPELGCRRRRDVQERMGYFVRHRSFSLEDFVSAFSFGGLVRRAYERSVGAAATAALGQL